METPNQINQSPEEFNIAIANIFTFAHVAKGVAILFIMAFIASCSLNVAQNTEIKVLKSKIQRDSITIQAYKNL